MVGPCSALKQQRTPVGWEHDSVPDSAMFAAQTQSGGQRSAGAVLEFSSVFGAPQMQTQKMLHIYGIRGSSAVTWQYKQICSTVLTDFHLHAQLTTRGRNVPSNRGRHMRNIKETQLRYSADRDWTTIWERKNSLERARESIHEFTELTAVSLG